MKLAVIQFPGSNSDMLKGLLKVGIDAALVDYRETSLDDFDGVVLPGGASFGNYLRPGAIAKVAPVIPAIVQMNEDKKPVIGINNGFQILTEIHLLPGVLMKNDNQQFISRNETLQVVHNNSAFTKHYNETVELPIAHAYGQYFAPIDILDELEQNNQILFTYTNNPNGSARNIAGITNASGNVLGMMPHPERALDQIVGTDDGLQLFKNIANWGQQ